MAYMTVSIGNTDNRLTQQEWSDFVSEMAGVLAAPNTKTHFFGGPANFTPWQNAAWIIEANEKDFKMLAFHIKRVREKWKQDNAFILVGNGNFV